MIGIEKLQMAQAPATKSKIEFNENDLLKSPPVVAGKVASNAKPAAEMAQTPAPADKETESVSTAAAAAEKGQRTDRL